MKIRFQPYGVATQVEPGITLLQAAQQAGVEIESVCNGKGTCGKCRIIAPHGVSPLTALEARALSEVELAQGYRLACQATVTGDVEAVVPEESRRSRVSILVDGLQSELPQDPWLRVEAVQVPEPSLEHQIGDLERLEQVRANAGLEPISMTLYALRQLPQAVRQVGGVLQLVMADQVVLEVLPGTEPPRLLGMAFDIGTTTIAGYLIDLATCTQLAVASRLNPQTQQGDDVISRIEFSERGDGLVVLQRQVVEAINAIINDTTTQAGVARESVYGITLVGNTTMTHLLLGVSPTAMAQTPYVPAFAEMRSLCAADLGIRAHPEAPAWILPNIAGWVGADTTAVILATDLQNQSELALAVDIGTNGEMALGSAERLIACSTAAGPAFEGAHLSCGMRAADGAVDAVRIGDDLIWHTIGEAPPRGICGSGLVDLSAELLRVGVVSKSGMLNSADEQRALGLPEALVTRTRGEGRQRAFMVAGAAEGAGGRELLITQRDIRELQLAKGAIRAGVEIMMRELGITADAVRRVYLAGAFGNYINPENAVAIGLIPSFPNADLLPVGNAAGSGAKMALCSASARKEAACLTSHVEYIELSGRPDFQDQFAESMLF